MPPIIHTFHDQFVEGATGCLLCGVARGEVDKGTFLSRHQMDGVDLSKLVKMTSETVRDGGGGGRKESKEKVEHKMDGEEVKEVYKNREKG